MKRFFTSLVSFLLLAPAIACAQSYDISVIHYPAGNDVFTFPRGINDRGTVAGEYNTNGEWNSFIYDGRSYREFRLNGFETSLYGINGSGRLIGTYNNGTGSSAFIYDGRTAASIDYPGAFYSRPIDINNSGTVLGYYSPDSSRAHGGYYLYDSGRFTPVDIAIPGATGTVLSGLNDRGDIAGAYTTSPYGTVDVYSQDNYGFIYSNGALNIVSYPGAASNSTVLVDVNNSGEAVGMYKDEFDVPINFTYRNGRFGALPFLSDMQYVTGINNRGQIAGSFYAPWGDLYDMDHGFLFTPRATSSAPEPGAMALFGTALAGVVIFRKKTGSLS